MNQINETELSPKAKHIFEIMDQIYQETRTELIERKLNDTINSTHRDLFINDFENFSYFWQAIKSKSLVIETISIINFSGKLNWLYWPSKIPSEKFEFIADPKENEEDTQPVISGVTLEYFSQLVAEELSTSEGKVTIRLQGLEA